MLLRALLALLLLVTRCLVQLPSIICDILFFSRPLGQKIQCVTYLFFFIPHRNNNNTTITPLSLLLSWLFSPNPFPFLNAKQVSFSPLSSLDMSRNQWSFGFLHTIMGILMWERLRKGICNITALCPQVAPSSPQIPPPKNFSLFLFILRCICTCRSCQSIPFWYANVQSQTPNPNSLKIT